MATAVACDRIFYDGDCGVCHWSVGFVARHDPTGEAFRFAPLHGEVFEETVGEAAGRELLLRSQGAVYILCRLGPFWRFLGRLLAVVPRPIRDYLYDRFAANRKLLASKPEATCPVLPPELRRRFDP
jgi:predicted DCC family thiol-disulfide oxidoreductase YuxK